MLSAILHDPEAGRNGKRSDATRPGDGDDDDGGGMSDVGVAVQAPNSQPFASARLSPDPFVLD